MKTTRILVLSAALIASVLISVSASAQQEAPAHGHQGFDPQHHEMNPEKAAEMRARHMQKAYNLDEKAYKQLVKHYKKDFKEMKKKGEFRKEQDAELARILGPENYKKYKESQRGGHHGQHNGSHPGQHPGQHPGNHGHNPHHAQPGHPGGPHHNHVEKPVQPEVK